jgi:hypothetical protein
MSRRGPHLGHECDIRKIYRYNTVKPGVREFHHDIAEKYLFTDLSVETENPLVREIWYVLR